ncbi:MAG TPA: right-handed parallel beta-helix repeat-containing protein [Candidatus Paceibacterota bacterium]|nr:right-handed parallel beta-helix repeat-containing protein [Candidatus Paceibacterota bacterium]
MSTGAGDKIVMATSTSLIGQGPSTRIFIASSTNANVDVIDANRTPFITIADLMIDGNSPRNSSGTQNGIVFTAVSTSTIRNIVASSTRSSGLRLLSSSDGNMVENSIINLHGSSGVDINASSRNIVQGNQLPGNSIYGIIQTGGTLNRYSNNSISGTGAGGSGIHLTVNAERNIVEGNSIVGGAGIGIAVYSGGTHNLISNNVVANNADMGIAVYFNDPTENQVTGNLLRDNAGAGSSANLFVDADRTMVSGNYIIDSAGTGVAINIAAGANNVVVGNTYTGTGATRMSNLGTGTKFTQWDRITLENPSGAIPEVTYSLLGIVASTTAPLASTTQTGAGKLLSLNNTVGEMFTVANNGYVGIGTSSPYAKLSVTGQVAAEFFTGTSTTASSTFASNVSIGTATSSGAEYQIGGRGILTRLNGAVILGETEADARGIFALDLQSVRTASTQVASGANSIAVGRGNTAGGSSNISIGISNTSGNLNSIAIGVSNTANDVNTMAIGRSNSITAQNSSAFGSSNTFNATAGSSLTFGDSNAVEASASGVAAFGVSNTTGGTNASAFGRANIARLTNSSAFGYQNWALGTLSSAMGASSTASGLLSSAFGYNNLATAQGASAFGSNLTNTTASSTDLGPDNASKVTVFNSGIFQASSLNISSTTATSTFANGIEVTTAGGLHLSNGGLRVNNLNAASCDLKSDTNGVFFCGTDAVGGGSSSEVNWTYNYAGLTRVSSSTSQVLIGATATTSTSKLEVAGDIRAEYFTATSTTATSTFANGISLSGGCFQDTSGKCIGKGRDGTYIVAAYNSTNKAYADYVADYNNDEVEINQAITAAYGNGRGGKVYLLEGDFRVGTSTAAGDAIVMATSTSLIGAGAGTRITLASSTPGSANIIAAYNSQSILLRDFQINGNKENQGGNGYIGVLLSETSSSTIDSLIVTNVRSTGISLSGTNPSYNVISNNKVSYMSTAITSHGIIVAGLHNTVHGNIINIVARGIYIGGATPRTANSISANTITGATQEGIYVQANGNSISGNTVEGGATGIRVFQVSNNTLSGNFIANNSSNAIVVNSAGTSGDENIITGNMLYANAGSGVTAHISIDADRTVISSNSIVDTAGTGPAISLSSGSASTVVSANVYSGPGARTIEDLSGGNTQYTQWDRLTLDTRTLGEVAYSLLDIYASSSVALASTTQLGSGKILSLNNATGEKFTVSNAGLVGVGTTSPWAKFSVEMDTTNPAFVISNDASSSPSFYVAGVNQNGFVGFGTTTNYGGSHARMFIDASTSISGVTTAITGVHALYTFAPAAGGTQVGDRTVVINAATGTTPNTGVGRILRITDNTSLSNLVRGIEVVASVGENTLGVNTGIRSTGHTFGIQGITTGLAGGTSTPAAIYGENTGNTQGDVLRLYTASMTTATSMAQFFQESSAFSGAGLLMNFAAGSGSFTGNFLDLQYNSNSRFKVTAAGTTTIGQLNQTVTAAGLQIGYGGLCVDNDGSCVASTTGRVSAVSYTTGATDLAENYYSDDVLEAGDIVSTEGKYFVGKAATETDVVLGVVATKPGIILGESDRWLSDKPAFPVGLVGRVPVKVSTENGPIKIGDRIALSNLPGVGMRAVGSSSPVAGAIVGIALEEFDGAEYLSEATIEVMTERVASGTPVCTSKEIVRERKESGGADVEEGSDLVRAVETYTDTVETCAQEHVIVSPDAGLAAASTTLTEQTVRVGKILMFIDLSVERILPKAAAEPTEAGMVWIDDGTGAAEILQNLDLNGHGIRNVSRIASASGSWYIDEEGNIRAGTITARRVVAEESVEIGTGSRPTGITIYDTVTGLPYCMQVAAGALASTPGACSPTSIPPASSGAAPDPEPAPVSESEPPASEPVSETPSEEPAPEAPAPSDESVSTETPAEEPVLQPEASPEEAVVPAPEAVEDIVDGLPQETPAEMSVP